MFGQRSPPSLGARLLPERRPPGRRLGRWCSPLRTDQGGRLGQRGPSAMRRQLIYAQDAGGCGRIAVTSPGPLRTEQRRPSRGRKVRYLSLHRSMRASHDTVPKLARAAQGSPLPAVHLYVGLRTDLGMCPKGISNASPNGSAHSPPIEVFRGAWSVPSQA
jgi:hypothetical protein